MTSEDGITLDPLAVRVTRACFWLTCAACLTLAYAYPGNHVAFGVEAALIVGAITDWFCMDDWLSRFLLARRKTS